MAVKQAVRILLAVAALAVAARADTLKVPGDHLSIQAAVDVAVAGDSIAVAADVYDEEVDLTGKAGLTLKGKGAVVRGAVGMLLADCEDILVSGFVFEGGAIGVHVVNGDRVVVSKCEFRPQGDARAVFVEYSYDVTVTRCRIEGTAVTATGIDIHVANQIRVTKNVVSYPGPSAIRIDNESLFKTLYSDVLVEKNRILPGATDGIVLTGGEFEVLKNTVDGALSRGIAQLDSEGCHIDGNRVTGAGLHGISLAGRGHWARKNRLTDCHIGIHLSGEGLLADGCSITDSVGTGVALAGAMNNAAKCTVKGSGGDGILVMRPDSVVRGCKVSGCLGHGVHLLPAAARCTIQRTKVKGSGGFDCLDEAGAGGTIYRLNRFGTQRITNP